MRLLKGDTPASPHPRAGAATLIPRLGLGQARLVGTFIENGFQTVAVPLYRSDVVDQLPLESDLGRLGLVFDPMTHCREQPREKRPVSFRGLPFGDDPRPFNPESARLSDGTIERLACEPCELQRHAGGTLVLTPYHVAGGTGTRGRDLELLLATLAVARFRDQRFDEPPEGAPYSFPRQIFATIAIPIAALSSPDRCRTLAERYLAIPADGHWLKVRGFDEYASAPAVEAVGRFLSYLGEGQRPIVVCGPGQLVLPLLAEEISVSIGIASHERFKYPEPWTRPANGGASKGRVRPVYLPRLVRSLMSNDSNLAAAFERAPCRCGAHEPRKPPRGGTIDVHAARVRAEQALDALDGERADRREWLFAMDARGAEVAADLGLPKRPIGPLYRALLTGLSEGDVAEGQRPLADTG